MRWVLLLPVIFAAAVVSAGGGLSLGDYADLVKKRVEAKIIEALDERDVPDTVSGTVSLSTGEFFFLQGKEDALKVISGGGGKNPAAGSVVKVTGRPSLEGGRVVFMADRWVCEGKAPLPAAKRATARDLVFIARGAKDRARDINWRRVTVEGRAIGLTEHGFAMEVESIPVTVDVGQLPDFVENCGELRPLVSVTGVAELILDQSTLFGRDSYVMGVKITASGDSDIVLRPDLTYLVNRRDRTMVILEVSVFAALLVLLVIVVAFAVRQARRNLSARTIMQERKRMADDLHDTIEQHLVGAGMLLQLSKTKQAREILLRAKSEMRDIVWGLKNDDMMRMTPAQMIKSLAREETKKGICRVVARIVGLPEKMELSAMRDLSLVIREAIGNAIKHGRAKKIAISCDPLPGGGWLLRIANDGEAFNAETAPGPDQGHFGLEGMRERSRRIGAKLSFSFNGRMTVISLEKNR